MSAARFTRRRFAAVRSARLPAFQALYTGRQRGQQGEPLMAGDWHRRQRTGCFMRPAVGHSQPEELAAPIGPRGILPRHTRRRQQGLT